MPTTTPSRSAAHFRSLHQRGPILLLPNAWDAASARLVESSGAAAIATSSAAVSWAHGVPDGERLDPEVLLWSTREIAGAVQVPLSVDVEEGYGGDLDAFGGLVRRLLEAGAVGVNIEDGGGAPAALAAKIARARQSAREAGQDLFVNARTDVYLRALAPEAERVRETLDRARRYRDAGCDGLFVPGLTDEVDIAVIAREAALPLNLMAGPELASVARLEGLGARRLSLGMALAQAAWGLVRRSCQDLLVRGEYGALFEGAVAYDEMNALFASHGQDVREARQVMPIQ
jgi:2-methylisocitrate lyase-like PEP mutase family enzyme